MTASRGIRIKRGEPQAFVEREQGKHFCICGCEAPIPIKTAHLKRGVPQFIQGHNAKLNPPADEQVQRTRELRTTMGSTIVQEYESGSTCKELGDKYGVSLNTIWNMVKDFGGVIRDPLLREGHPFHGRWGAEHPYWKGGTRITIDAYRKVWLSPDHPFSEAMRSKGESYVYEHRLVMAHHLGRPLLRTETVHHIDGDRLNNDISNLQLRRRDHGIGVKFGCLDCGSHNVGPLPLD